MKKFHVYEDWTNSEPSICFYVGKGDDDRVLNLKRNEMHSNVVRTMGQNRIITLTTFDEAEALMLEKKLIHERHTHPKDPQYNGIGCNRTFGGQGNSGRIVSLETREKISQAKRGKSIVRIWSEEQKNSHAKRMSEVHKGKTLSVEHRAFLSDRMNDPMIKNAMIAKVKTRLQEKYTDPAYRKRIIETRSRGESHTLTPFDTNEILLMREEWKNVDKTRGNRWHISPSRQFCARWASIKGVSNQAIYAIVTGKTWKHLL